MSSIVQKIHKKNSVSRNVFDLSNNVQFTTCPGMLLPVRTDETLPGDEFRFSISAFARTVQMVVPSFARVKAHIDSFFVPYRLLGTDYQSIIVGDNRGMIGNYNGGSYTDRVGYLPRVSNSILDASLSQTTNTDAQGINYAVTSRILANALGYGFGALSVDQVRYSTDGNLLSDGSLGSSVNSTDFGDTTSSNSLYFNLLPFQAYQKIYQDYYRNKLWEKENRSAYFFGPDMDNSLLTVSRLVNTGLIEMRYHDFEKDRITGIIPDENSILTDGVSAYAQDIVSALPLGLDSLVSLGSDQVPSSSTRIPNVNHNATGVTVAQSNVTSGKLISDENNGVLSNGYTGSDFSPILNRLSALSLRRLQAFQKFAEITDLSKSDYKHQIKAHFNFNVPDLNSDYCDYIGGCDIPLNISDVENTNGASVSGTTNSLGYLGGKGTMSGNSSSFSYKCKEHGIIMIILYILPQVDYLNVFTDRSTLRFGRYDFAIPEFDDLGFEPVRMLDVYNTLVTEDVNSSSIEFNPARVIGYLPRYWYYKTKVDCNYSPAFRRSSTPISSSSLNYGSYIVPFPYYSFLENCAAGTTYRGLKVPINILKSLFPLEVDTTSATSFADTCPFIFTIHFQASVMRSLSVDGLPY